jgi:hypothetical protein
VNHHQQTASDAIRALLGACDRIDADKTERYADNADKTREKLLLLGECLAGALFVAGLTEEAAHLLQVTR